MNDWFMSLMNDLLMLLVDDWLMNLTNLLLVDDRLMQFMNDILMVLMHNVLMMFMHHVLMMLMDHIPMSLFHDGCRGLNIDSCGQGVPINNGCGHISGNDSWLVVSNVLCSGLSHLNWLLLDDPLLLNKLLLLDWSSDYFLLDNSLRGNGYLLSGYLGSLEWN